MMSSPDPPPWPDAEDMPDMLLLRLLGAVDQDERATMAPGGQPLVADASHILRLPPDKLRPSVALARLRRPVEPA